MTDWTVSRVGFMEQALPYTDYYRAIARRMAPYLPREGHVCDAGCGLGELGICLLPYCGRVTCVDRSKRAIESLRRRAPAGITALCGDVAALLPAEPYDAMVFCLFGDMEQTLALAKTQCSGKVLLIKREYDTHRFSPGELPLGDYTAQNARQTLQRRGIPWQEETFTADFGQPFRSLEEAERFFALYNRSESRAFTRQEIAARLIDGPDETFPLYLPNEKRLCLLVFDARDII